jgi:hypothetical protein
VVRLAESNNKFVIIVVGILSLMMIIPVIETGGAFLAILFIILAIVGLKVISSSKTDSSHNPMHRQPLDEESWSDAIKKLLFVLILSGVWGLMWMYFLW